MKYFIFCSAFLIITACGAGYSRVKYKEMPEAPQITLKDKELIVTTRNGDGEGLSVYKVDIDIRDRARIIELKGYQAIGKPEKTEFTLELTDSQISEIKEYRVYWVDPGGRKNKIAVRTEF